MTRGQEKNDSRIDQKAGGMGPKQLAAVRVCNSNGWGRTSSRVPMTSTGTSRTTTTKI